jgi:hypothetical protein
MKSPFPGMDPYIEVCGLWEGFHSHLIEAIYQVLAPVIPRGYIIDTAVRSYVVLVAGEGKDETLVKPDVTIAEPARGGKRRPNRATAVADATETDESVPMQALIAREFEESFVEIYAELEERVLVTCIEVLSPSNKRPRTEGWTQYQHKRQALLLGRANFIEIDLLRGGKKPPMLTAWPASPYTLLVSRQSRAPRCRAWKGHFLRRLPPIPVPLLAPDADLTLDLQPLVDHIYTLGRYDERIDYSRNLSPRLSAADATAVRDLLKGRTTRAPRRGRKT